MWPGSLPGPQLRWLASTPDPGHAGYTFLMIQSQVSQEPSTEGFSPSARHMSLPTSHRQVLIRFYHNLIVTAQRYDPARGYTDGSSGRAEVLACGLFSSQDSDLPEETGVSRVYEPCCARSAASRKTAVRARLPIPMS